MKLKHILAGIAALLIGGVALAQSISVPLVTSMGTSDLLHVIPRGQPSAQNVYANATILRSWLFGGGVSHTGTPALTSCGTSPAIATGSTDISGRVTTGTGSPTGCVITFAQAYAATPACVLVSQTAYATTTPSYTVSATAITLTQTGTNSAIYNYVCSGMTGG